jgi:hypothetical protein
MQKLCSSVYSPACFISKTNQEIMMKADIGVYRYARVVRKVYSAISDHNTLFKEILKYMPQMQILLRLITALIWDISECHIY